MRRERLFQWGRQHHGDETDECLYQYRDGPARKPIIHVHVDALESEVTLQISNS